MLINFNIKKLDRLLYDFHTITGLTVSIWDAQFQQLCFQPKEMRSFCRTIRTCPEINHSCFLCDKELCMQSAATGKPATHYCHAGLIDTAIPIKFKDTIMGYIMFGQITDNHQKGQETILKKLSKKSGFSFDMLKKLYNELEIYDEEKVNSAANILKIATRSLWLSEYVEIGYNTTASKIDDYIRNHLNGDLSITSLCNALGISKNRLYEISHESFGMTIGEFISNTRIQKAKELLSTTDLAVTQISSMVGINNYNYFTKFFKSSVGVPPLKYRKEFPFNIES